MIVLLRSTDGNPDSRFEKYVDFLEENKIAYLTICWDRKLNKTTTDNKYYYKKPSAYGKRYNNIGGLIGFNWYILKVLWRNRKKYNVIHACDFDTILPAVIIHVILRKKIIYDVFDWYVDSRSISSVFKYLIYMFEFINIKLSEVVIICEPEREKQIRFKPKKLWILPNIPNFSYTLPRHNLNNILTIGYVGILGGARGLENLIKYAKNNKDIKLNIGGFGPLESELKDLSDYPNITYYGSVPYARAIEILNDSDIIYACYEKVNPNHILAAPNKYYEGLYLAHPIITTSGTIVGDKTIKYQTGFIVNEGYDDLEVLLRNITKDKMIECSNNAYHLWNSRYKTYVRDFLEKEYLPFILSYNK